MLDYVKRNRIIRSRGYSFEKKIVESLLKIEDWNAKRLGGTTTTMPDIIASNVNKSIFLAIECKSTDSTQVSIEKDQIDRLIDTIESQPYKHKYACFAFKFKRKVYPNAKRIAPLKYLVYGFKDLDIGMIDHVTAYRGSDMIKMLQKQKNGYLFVTEPMPSFIIRNLRDLANI